MLQQRFVIKLWVAEKSKTWILAYFSWKKSLQMGKALVCHFVPESIKQSVVHGIETDELSGKGKVQGAAISKEVYADSVLGHKRTYRYL